MNLLAFDTACDACSVALWRDGAVVSRRARAMVRGQSEALVPMIDSVMREAAVDFTALSAVGVTIGPGAFTGLRIALATARAIGLAAQRPVIGISTFEAIAAAAARGVTDTSHTLVIAIDIKRDDLYVQSFSFDESDGFIPCGAPAALAVAEVDETLPPGPALLAGDGAQRLAAVLNRTVARATVTGISVPDAADVAAIAARRLTAGAPLPPVRPLYLRPPAVRVPHPAGIGSPP